MHAQFFTEDQLVVVNRANRQADSLMKRLHREETPKNARAHIAEILKGRSDALVAEQGDMDEEAVRVAMLKRSGGLRSLLSSLSVYCTEESVEVTNVEIKELMKLADNPWGFDNEHEKLWDLACKTGARNFAPELRERATTSPEEVETYRKKLKKDHPLMMAALQHMFNWKRSALADLVLLINLKS